ncbi:MAG: response regulator transcription factor [Terracidiphilus sp.]|jgi:DNA-binding response OmpR family regulator
MGSPLVPAELPADDMHSNWLPATPVGDAPLEDHLIERPKILTTSKLLVIDDDIALGKFLIRELKRRQFSVEVRHDGQTGCDVIRESAFDLVILDLNMPKMDGIAVIGQVRLMNPRLPILVLTARNRTEDLVMALERGADDCLIKPFSFLELLARVRCLLRRNSTSEVSASNVGNLTINREEHWVMRGTRRIDLTVREFALLEYLMNNVGKAISRKTLMEEVWNIPTDSTTNIVDVYMKYLRDKVDLPGEVKLIRTVRGVGYVLNNE